MEYIIDYANGINNIINNKYIIKLHNNTSIEQFISSQINFIDAVDNWSKILGIMLSKVPTDQERTVIINNLYDEHGSGDYTKSHVNTFRSFMASLGYPNKLELHDFNKKTYQCVKKFNDSLYTYLNTHNWIHNIAMLGIIEYVYITISTHIHNYVKQYIPSNQITHYSSHEILDVKHSTELFELIVPYLSTHETDIKDGIITGYTIFYSLYDGLSTFL